MHAVVPHQVKHPRYSHVVHVPPTLNSGRQGRKYFNSEAAAQEYCDTLAATVKRVGMGFFMDMNEEERGRAAGFIQSLRKAKGRTFADLWQRFMEYQAAASGDLHRRGLKQKAAAILVRWGAVPIHDLQGGDIREWVNALKRQDGAPMEKSTRHSYFRAIRAALNFAVASGWLTINPCLAVARHIPKGEPPKGILTPQQFAAVWAQGEQAPFRRWLALGAFAGLRPCEAIALEWSHVDFDANEIYVPPTITKKTKGERTEGRVIELQPNLKAILLSQRQSAGGIVGLGSCQISRRKWSAEAKADVDIPHDALRHSFATYLYTLKRDMAQVSAQLGHTGSGTTLRHYARRDMPRAVAEEWFAFGIGKA